MSLSLIAAASLEIVAVYNILGSDEKDCSKIFLVALAEDGTGPRRASYYKIKFNDSGTISYAYGENDITYVIFHVLLLILLYLSIYLA